MSRTEKMQKEFEELIKESNRKDDEIMERLKKEGRHGGGMDSNREDFRPVREWLSKQIADLKEKYKDLA